jgi:hypothetical protein
MFRSVYKCNYRLEDLPPILKLDFRENRHNGSRVCADFTWIVSHLELITYSYSAMVLDIEA